jgi:crotonobetainyl-CoA:carnitine CoA-transferase CaiB-like acyl-CoA transferase
MIWCKAQCFAALEQAVIPAGPINTVEEALADPQIVARGLQIALEGIPGLRSPLRFTRSGLVLDRAAPQKH